ncbi:hypothetical protein EPA93_03975 [Ktedonosporobacter rubrisoli]|uniref:Uncharacterized protein n=1 Tax=Ktedonosporobacter rubrisoli TaxID=2509675 RepID=A0A4P6JJB2_KTERU|nr:hypothetical protein [Ktedonosporobacter rubrisoli]QBD75195.1 hypothetical protein EPA93_03975 [Ktedonosporobacter rubrisoli]
MAFFLKNIDTIFWVSVAAAVLILWFVPQNPHSHYPPSRHQRPRHPHPRRRATEAERKMEYKKKIEYYNKSLWTNYWFRLLHRSKGDDR